MRLSTLCVQSEHCAFEMEEKMRRWKLPDEVIARVMAYLINHEFINDERFTRAFVIDKIRYSKWGRRKVEQALWAKHVDEGLRQRVLDEVDDEEYLKVLRPLLKSKMKTTKAAGEYELNMKLIRFAMGRGFTIELIRRCLPGATDVEVDE